MLTEAESSAVAVLVNLLGFDLGLRVSLDLELDVLLVDWRGRMLVAE